MTTKKLLLMVTFTTLIASSESCYSMENTEDTEDMENTKNMGYMERAGNFINRCRYIGILPTLYASVGVYDFNKITGLDKNQLDTYNDTTIENAMARINTFAQYGATSPELKEFYNILQTKYLEAQSRQQTMPMERRRNNSRIKKFNKKRGS